MWAKDGTNIGDPAKGLKWPQYCRQCHGGDKLGGIHGSNAAVGRASGQTLPQSFRFLNGGSWNGLALPTTGNSNMTCYTISTATSVSGCTQHKTAGGSTYTGAPATYDYTGY